MPYLPGRFTIPFLILKPKYTQPPLPILSPAKGKYRFDIVGGFWLFLMIFLAGREKASPVMVTMTTVMMMTKII